MSYYHDENAKNEDCCAQYTECELFDDFFYYSELEEMEYEYEYEYVYEYVYR